VDLAKAGVDMGNVPDWFAAVGTSAAAIIAVVVLGREIRTRRNAAWAEFSHQARRVLCWLDTVEVEGVVPDGRTYPTLAVIVRNGSEAPVLDCNAHVEVDPAVLAELKDGGGPSAGVHRAGSSRRASCGTQCTCRPTRGPPRWCG